MATTNKEFRAKNGIISAGKITGPTPTTSLASFNFPHGTAPSAPSNGDAWTTTSGFYVRINGTTVGPLGTGGGGSTFDAITTTSGSATAATLWSDVTTGSITIGNGLTSGNVNLGNSSMSGAVVAKSNQMYVGSTNLQQFIFTGGATSHSLEIGRQDGTSSTPYIDFHSGTTATDYDVRVIANGGNGSSGNGDLTVTGNKLTTPNALTIGNTSGQQVVFTAGATNHGIEIGRVDGTSSTPFIDFHSSSTAADYDFRMINTGTATPGTSGGGYMEWWGKLIQLNAPTGQNPTLTLQSANGAGYYPAFFNFTRTGLSGAATPDNVSIGTFRFDGRDGAGSYASFAEIEVGIGTNATGGAPADITFRTATSGGGTTESLKINSDKSINVYGSLYGPVIHSNTSAPGGTLYDGQPWFNKTDGSLYIYNSSTWLEIGGAGAYSDGGDLTIADNHDLYMYTASDTPETAAGPGLTKARAGGLAVQNGDYLGYLGYVFGADTSSTTNDAGFAAMIVDGTVSSGIVPTKFRVSTANSAGAMTPRMDWNADGSVAVLGSGYLRVPAISTPSAAPTDTINIFGRKIANKRILPAVIGPSGLDTALQPLIARNKVVWARPVAGAATVNVMGVTLTATGTLTAKTWASTNVHTQTAGANYLVTTAATTAVAGYRSSANAYWFGNAAGLGGFTYVSRWAPATGVSTTTMRAFTGMSTNTSAPTDVQPSSLVNMFGMGWDAADTNIQFMCNDGSGTATKTDLGASFPVPTTDASVVYELAMFVAPNTSVVYYEITNVGTGAKATGSASSDLPSSTTGLSPRGYCSVGGTSSVIGYTLFSLYIETDI